jgi:16S rRNA (uracil1498-N3)-methyltransferase
MHRCFIEPARWVEERISPSDSEAHHLRDVLRAEDGDAVTIFDGAGRQARAAVRIDADGALALDVAEITRASERPFELVLIQAIPKGARMDLIVEKATELGVARLIPVITDRGVVRLDAKQAKKRAERWDRIARSAAKQCGTPWLPCIDPVCSYAEAIEGLGQFDAALLGSLVEGVQSLCSVIETLRPEALSSLAVIIGPEGDLTDEETTPAVAAGALYAASVLAHEFLWRE